MLDDLARAPWAVGDDHRHARRHRFRDDVAEALEARGQHEQSGIVDPLAGTLGQPGQPHPIGQSQLLAQGLEPAALGAFAPDHQAPLGMVGGNPGKRRQQEVEALLLIQTPDRDQRAAVRAVASPPAADRPGSGSRGRGHGLPPAARSARPGSASPGSPPRRTGDGAASARPGSRSGARGCCAPRRPGRRSSPRVARIVMMLILARKEITRSGSIARSARRSTKMRRRLCRIERNRRSLATTSSSRRVTRGIDRIVGTRARRREGQQGHRPAMCRPMVCQRDHDALRAARAEGRDHQSNFHRAASARPEPRRAFARAGATRERRSIRREMLA